MHWANKDQYYVKSSEAFSHYSFNLNEALRMEAERLKGANTNAPGFDFDPAVDQAPLKVHFRLAAATEGEHNNVNDRQERFFLIHEAKPVKLETAARGDEMVIQSEYRADPDKAGQENTCQQKRLAEAEARALVAMRAMPQAQAFSRGLTGREACLIDDILALKAELAAVGWRTGGNPRACGWTSTGTRPCWPARRSGSSRSA